MRQDDIHKLVIVISRYGWHGIRHASHMLRYLADDLMWREYTATVLWSIGKLLSKDYPLPSYEELKNPKPVNKQTAREIIDGLRAKLLQEGGENA